MKKWLAGAALLAISGSAFAAHIIITTNFKNLTGHPRLLIMTRGLSLNNQTVTPYILHLNKKTQGFRLPTNAHNYQILAFQIKYGDSETIIPCKLTKQPITHQDTNILLSGTLTPNHPKLSCGTSYTISMIEHSNENLAAASAAGGTGKKSLGLLARMKKAFKKGYSAATGKSLVHFSYPGISRYLRKLRDCSPGIVTAKDPITKKQIIYHIYGQKQGKCLVTMDSPGEKKKMRCAFNAKQTSAVASFKNIQMFSKGKLKINPKDAASKAYDKACEVSS